MIEAAAKLFAEKLTGSCEASVSPLRQTRGIDNMLYLLSHGTEKILLRIAMTEEGRKKHEKEFLIAKRAGALGVSTLCYQHHLVNGAFSCLTRPYVTAKHPDSAAETDAAWQFLGHSARTLHRTRISGVGEQALITEHSDASWTEWLASAFEKADIALLLEYGVLQKKVADEVFHRLGALANWKFNPGLSHGDLSLNNVLLDSKNDFVLIDWGNATAHRVPHFEVSEIETWCETPDWRAAFASGYGIGLEELETILDETRILRLWRVLWAISRDIRRHKTEWHRAKYASRSVQELEKLLRFYHLG